jgi:6-phosphogluconolactonase/glucosamine-6-phosphate isomerase/deaminase
MEKHHFSKIGISVIYTYLSDGTEPDSGKACRNYQNIIRQTGGVDMKLLGLGITDTLSRFDRRIFIVEELCINFYW